MEQHLVLSLFPGIGLLDYAFEMENFCVVRGPDVMWGGDIRRFHAPAGVFKGVIGGPPCQAFSRMAHMVRYNGYQPKFGNLIPEFERVVAEAAPQWFVMEEVPDAPRPRVEGYGVWDGVLNNRQCIDPETGAAAEQHRTRAISFGWRGGRRVLPIEVATWQNPRMELAALGGCRTDNIPQIARGGSGKVKKTARTARSQVGQTIRSVGALAKLLRLQGLPADFVEHCPLTVAGKCQAIGNGVPLPMGLALARAVKEVLHVAGSS